MKIALLLVLVFCLLITVNAQIEGAADSIDTLIRNGDINTARQILKSRYSENDDDPLTNYWLGVLALRDTLYDEAIDYFDVAIDGDEKNAEYYFWLGRAYAMKAQNSGAITAAFAAPKIKSNWLKTLELDPEHVPAKWGLFQYYINAPGVMGGDDEEAKKLAEDLSTNDPPRGYNMLAYYYAFVEEDFLKADSALIKSMEFNTDEETARIVLNSNTNLLNQLGYRFLNQEDLNNSYKYFKWAIRIRPDYENPYDSMGDYFAAIAQFDSALIYYEKALTIRPDFTVSIFNKALMLEKLGKKDQAKALYKVLIEKYPDSSYADRAADRLKDLPD